jgi:hypothetical protein
MPTEFDNDLTWQRWAMGAVQEILRKNNLFDQFQPEDRTRLETQAKAVIEKLMSGPFREAMELFWAWIKRARMAEDYHWALLEKNRNRRMEAGWRSVQPIRDAHPDWNAAQCVAHLQQQLDADPAIRHEPQPGATKVHSPGNA